MKILVLNGSPKGTKSNTYCITEAFLDGMISELGGSAATEVIDVYASHIEHCRGCFCCWTATPGKCIIHDDMEEILPKMLEADLIIWSFPLYYYGMPSKIKALLDRNLPFNLPYMEPRPDGSCGHPSRYGAEPAENILISTCGFYSIKNNYEALTTQFDILFGKDGTKILCPEGELFAQPALRKRTEEYLSYAWLAGREYAQNKCITDQTMQNLNELLYEPNVFAAMADASWDIADETKQQSQTDKNTNAAERFTKQMAATYHTGSFDGTERVFEIYYTDAEAGYQLVLGKESCEVRTAGFTAYTTRVETPLTVWKDIAEGKYSGEQAMMEGRYKAFGDIKLLMSWGQYFNSGGAEISRGLPEENRPEKKTNMVLMITLWTVIWVLLTIHPVIGGIAGICAAAFVHLAKRKWTLTVYDDISGLCVTGFSLLALLGAPVQIVVPVSYFCFGLMWIASCFTAAPLSAHYSKNDYNGDYALQSPLFIRTNLILTICWGLLYFITPVWTYFIMGSSMPYLTAVVNTICPALMGIFTAWFQKWYPAKVLRMD